MTLMGAIHYFGYPAVGIAVLAILFRLVRGPSLADRVVALDLLAASLLFLLALLALESQAHYLIDCFLVLSLVSFVGTVAYAHALGEQRRPHE